MERAPSSSETIRKTAQEVASIGSITGLIVATSCVGLRSHVWLAKLLSPKSKLRIVEVLLGTLHRLFPREGKTVWLALGPQTKVWGGEVDPHTTLNFTIWLPLTLAATPPPRILVPDLKTIWKNRFFFTFFDFFYVMYFLILIPKNQTSSKWNLTRFRDTASLKLKLFRNFVWGYDFFTSLSRGLRPLMTPAVHYWVLVSLMLGLSMLLHCKLYPVDSKKQDKKMTKSQKKNLNPKKKD